MSARSPGCSAADGCRTRGGQPDVLAATPAGTLAVQSKTRASVPAWRTAAIGQAIRDAITTDLEAVQIVVIAHPSSVVGTRRYAVLEIEQLVRLLSSADPGGGQDGP